MKRREFIKQTGLMSAAAAAGVAGLAGSAGAAEEAKQGLAKIKLGSLEVSRLILGSNPFWGYSHKSKELDEQMKAYYTDERITAVLEEAARWGITAIASPPEERWITLYKKYLEGGGKLKIWIAQCHNGPEQMKDEIDRAAKGGAKAMFIQGARVEDQFAKGAFDTLKEWLERIKGHGVPAGLAAHWPEVHPEIEKRKLPADYYYQCFYNVSKGETYRETEREKAVEMLRAIEKPVVAYKILGAGRLTPDEGFTYAFNHIRRKDGVCVGIYTKDAVDQIRQNTTLVEGLSPA